MSFGRKGLSAPPAPPLGAGDGALSGPLFNGIQYVGAVSPPGAFLDAMTSPEPCIGPGGVRGVRFAIQTDAGPGHAFIFPSFASIWLAKEPAPRPPIPTEMIANRVPGYAAESGDLLSAG